MLKHKASKVRIVSRKLSESRQSLPVINNDAGH